MRCIDADKLLEGEHFILKCKSEFGTTEMDVFRREVIENAPTVDDYPFEQVQELVKLNQQFAQEIENLKRPTGKWIEFKGGYYKCDKCGEVERAKKNFCSRCGNAMRGKENG